MKQFALIIICLLQVVINAHADSRYTVIGPGTIHSNHKYTVSVSVHHATEPSTIKVGITGPSYNEIKVVELSGDEVKNVDFDVPLLQKGTYNLTAEGVSGITFTNTTALEFGRFSKNLQIQTDKGKYKPGDVVNFRVLFLDENLLPAVPDPEAIIWIEDNNRNRIKEYTAIVATKGVYTNHFKISEFPTLGGWRLIARDDPDLHPNYAYFDVEKYVLPKYKVEVEATEKVSVRDGDMQVVVRANYTYGKPVNGKVTLVIDMGQNYYRNDDKESPLPEAIIRTTDMVNGKAKFDLNIKEWEGNLRDQRYFSYAEVLATVEENFTGVKINGTTSTQVYPYRYEMACVQYETCSTYHADEEMDVPVRITYVDGTPTGDTKNQVKITYTEVIRRSSWWQGEYDAEARNLPFPDIENKTFTFDSRLNSTGVAVFKVQLPLLEEIRGFSRYFKANVSYMDENRFLLSTYLYTKPRQIEHPKDEPKDFFKIKPNFKENKYSFKLGEEMVFTLNSSVPLTYFVYHVIGRANIIHSELVELQSPSNTFDLKFTSTFPMSPNGKLYVYYVDEKGDFHFAEKHFRVAVELRNKIEISAPDQVKPGEEVALRIKTAPNSFVGLTSVDQSVLLLGGGNEINAEDFHWQLGLFDTHTQWPGGYGRYPGQETGVVTLTNAHFEYNTTQPGFMPRTVTKTAVYNSVAAAAPVNDAEISMLPAEGFGAAAGKGPSVQVRRNFEETWIFANIENTETEEFTWSKPIPDTITSWMLSAFSINPELGIGVTKDKTKITTFQPFFIAIRLPYSVKRGEVINIPALVFNYLSKDLDVEVTLDNTDDEFDFTDVSNEVINEQRRTRSIRVPANEAMGASFMVRPKVVGNIMLKFTATSPIAGDAIHKTLKVVPEGITQYVNRAYFVNLKDSPNFKDTFELELPAEVVPDSEHIEFSVIGDLLGPVVSNLNHLVRLPTGCGEQILSAMVPNYQVYRYLKNTNQLTPKLESETKYNLESGYQNLLRYAHEDGSFSSFGPTTRDDQPRNGSTWLTAYAVRFLQQLKEIVHIDEKILEKGLNYLTTKQAENGTFTEDGEYFYDAQNRHLDLTASVLLAFLENESNSAYQDQIDKGFKYILENLEKTENLRTRALSTYTLLRAKHELASEYISKLKGTAKTEGDRMWWSEMERPLKNWWCGFYSNDVEITAYVLLTLLGSETETVDSVLPIMKWLVAQRNNYGGFASTQDTVVGLQALIRFVEKSGYEPAIMSVDFTAKAPTEKRDTIHVTQDNGLLMQTVDLPQKTQSVDVEAQGKGAALVQISYQYNILEKHPTPSFTVNINVNKDTPPHLLMMDVCVEYTGEGDASNMAVLEISLPSGYIAEEDSFDRITEIDRVRLVETKNSDSMIVVYFANLHKNKKQCLPVEATKAFAVAKQKPSSVVIYDYYEISRRADTYYDVTSQICDICDDDIQCQEACT